jgi:hypothetical protein
MTRARRAFWTLVAVAVLAMGTLSTELAAPASPVTGALVAISGLVLVTALALALRILHHLEPSQHKEDE